jgi:hypothetical protein
MAAEFAVTNDQSGDQKDITLKEWEKLQLQGYRIVDVAAYDNAVAAAPEPRAQPAASAESSDAAGGYDEMTVPMLREECERRELDAASDARKADLVAMLEADDASDGGD